MRKFMIGAVVAAAAFSMAPASASGECVVGPGEYQAGGSCEYDATGPGTLVVLTPNSVKVVVTDANDEVRSTINLSSANPSAQGSHAIDSQAGDTVSIEVGPDCAYDPVCGHIGLVIAGND